MRVLIVEDSPSVSMLIFRIVENEGHEAVPAESGEEALEFFEAQHFDLVLMDVELPGMNGFETTMRIRAQSISHWLPIIFLSSNTEDEYLATGIEAGGDDYLSKPVKPIVLRAKISAMGRIAQIQKELNKVNERLALANQELKKTAAQDGLTGVNNRRAFDTHLHKEWSRSQRDKTLVSLIMIDIDLFKGFNDRYGHLKGDHCLKKVAQILQNSTSRPSDLTSRYGGEEFAIILPNTDSVGASQIANIILENLRFAAIPYPDSLIRKYVTVSMGICCSDQISIYDAIPEQNFNETMLIQKADDMLYHAKEDGRNQYQIYSQDQTTHLELAKGTCTPHLTNPKRPN